MAPPDTSTTLGYNEDGGTPTDALPFKTVVGPDGVIRPVVATLDWEG